MTIVCRACELRVRSWIACCIESASPWFASDSTWVRLTTSSPIRCMSWSSRSASTRARWSRGRRSPWSPAAGSTRSAAWHVRDGSPFADSTSATPSAVARKRRSRLVRRWRSRSVDRLAGEACPRSSTGRAWSGTIVAVAAHGGEHPVRRARRASACDAGPARTRSVLQRSAPKPPRVRRARRLGCGNWSRFAAHDRARSRGRRSRQALARA